MRLVINSELTHFTAFGQDDAVAGLTVAVPLRAGDKVKALLQGSYDRNGASRLSVVLVTQGTGNFVTTRGVTKSWNALKWHYTLDASRSWKYQRDPRQYFTGGKEGMYWIAARPDAGHWGITGYVKQINFKETKIIFRIYCQEDDVAISTSGAFYLTKDDWITMGADQANRVAESGSHLSFVELTDNNNMAFTGMVDVPGLYIRGRIIGFNSLTDKGGLYDYGTRMFRIKRSGVYIFSIRADPFGTATTTVSLFVNTAMTLTCYGENGLPSGQSTVLDFMEDDILVVAPSHGNKGVDAGTMFSIAYVRAS